MGAADSANVANVANVANAAHAASAAAAAGLARLLSQRDAAEDGGEADAAGGEEALRCPMGHALRPSQASSRRCCDVCGEREFGGDGWRCR
eukprot:gene5296-10213_t